MGTQVVFICFFHVFSAAISKIFFHYYLIVFWTLSATYFITAAISQEEKVKRGRVRERNDFLPYLRIFKTILMPEPMPIVKNIDPSCRWENKIQAHVKFFPEKIGCDGKKTGDRKGAAINRSFQVKINPKPVTPQRMASAANMDPEHRKECHDGGSSGNC